MSTENTKTTQSERTYIEEDPCHWNPVEGRTAYYSELHARATTIVEDPDEYSEEWRLCDSCASLPIFEDFKKKPI